MSFQNYKTFFMVVVLFFTAMQSTFAAELPSRQIVLIPPVVEFLAMENNEPVEVPKADKDDLSARIAKKLMLQFEAGNRDIVLLDVDALATEMQSVENDELFTLIRRGDLEKSETDVLQRHLVENYPDSEVLIVRTRFYLEYWARSDRVFQVMDSVLLMADRSDKRMLIDARIHAGESLEKRWSGLAQERVTPRASEKGIDRAVTTIVDEYLAHVESKGQENE